MKVELPAFPETKAMSAETAEALRWLLSQQQGRGIAVWLVIGHLASFQELRATVGSQEAMAYGAGRRDAGLELMGLLEQADGDAWDLALRERRASLLRKQVDRAKKAQKAEQAEGDT